MRPWVLVYFGRYAADARPWLKADDANVRQIDCRDLKQINPAATVEKIGPAKNEPNN